MGVLYDYKGDVISKPKESWWNGKNIVFFGDSRTWYDGEIYYNDPSNPNTYTRPEWRGKVCKGFQRQVVNLLGANVTKNAAGGIDSATICSRIKAFNFTDYDGAFFSGGVNDYYAGRTVGTIASIGATFDLTTIYGNWQSAIEYVLNNYPEVKIFLSVPYQGELNGNEFPYEHALIKKHIADLYDLPCIDLYKGTGLNVLNRSYYYSDNSKLIHFNDYGNELIGKMIASFIDSY